MHEYKVIAQIQAENNKLRAQLARLDDVEGLAEVFYNAMYADQGGKWHAVETKDVWHDKAQAVINYIKGE